MSLIILWSVVIGLGALVAWSMVDGLVLNARRARRRFDALARALQRAPVEDEHGLRIDCEIDGRTITMRARHVGSQGSVRGETGRLWVTETPLRVTRWEMHDVGIRQRRRTGDFARRFAIRESGVPVRDGWLGEPVRQAVAAFFDAQLAIGTLRVDRGRLQHVVPWSSAPDRPTADDLRAFAARFGAVAEAFDTAASRRLPMD